MAKKFFFALFLAFSAAICYGQHCQWDGSTMIMLDIKKHPDQKIKRIYLLDSAGAVVMSKHFSAGKEDIDSARFWKNPPGIIKDPTHQRRGQYFAFAKDYEILALGGHTQPQPYSVLIMYTAGAKPMQKDIPLLSNHVHQLCTLNHELWSGNVKPMSIVL